MGILSNTVHLKKLAPNHDNGGHHPPLPSTYIYAPVGGVVWPSKCVWVGLADQVGCLWFGSNYGTLLWGMDYGREHIIGLQVG